MEINNSNMCIKLLLPNGKNVDILSDVLDEMANYIQNKDDIPESGGYLLGYQNKSTLNIIIDNLSVPYDGDEKSRVHFIMKDIHHKIFLKKNEPQKSYYMGVWHTHPQNIPNPSFVDLMDWKVTLMQDKTACEYVFFIIIGIRSFRVWVGDMVTKNIQEIHEVQCKNGIYLSR